MRRPARRGFLEERGGRGRKMRAEHQRGRRTVRRERCDEPARGVSGVVRHRPSALLPAARCAPASRAATSEAADDAELWIVDVGVDEAGQHEAAAPIVVTAPGSSVRTIVVVAAGDDASVAHEQSAIGVGTAGRPVSRKGWRECGRAWPATARWSLIEAPAAAARHALRRRRTPARASPGSSKSTAPASRRTRATASRSASRTEIASISGGSPTALLPNNDAGLGALAENRR